MNTPLNTPTSHPISDKADAMLGSAAQATGQAIDSADRATHRTFGALANSVEGMRQRAAPALHDLATSAEDLARNSAAAVRDRALRARDSSADFVREHPMQALLIAAGAGAALALIGRLILRGDSSGPYR